MVKGHLKENSLVAEMQIRQHEMISGLPRALGGLDEAADPHELIEAALVGCTILTCQLYANRKQWSLLSTEVQVKIESEDASGTVISRDIRFKGNLTNEQRERLFEIANKCPIHNLLVRSTKINSRLLNSP
jgi:putative redox protein